MSRNNYLIADRIKISRRLSSLGISNKQLASALSKPLPYVLDRMVGKRLFTSSDLITIADLLSCDLSDLMS